MTRLALWLAEWVDRWARRVTGDDLAERLAAADQLADTEADIDCWEIDHGAFIDRIAPVIHLHYRRN